MPALGRPIRPDVGQQLELQRQPRLVAGEPALGEPRRLMGRAGEPFVAAPAGTAAGDERALAGDDQVVSGAVATPAAPRCRAAPAARACRRRRRGAATPAVPAAHRLVVRGPPVGLQIAQRVVADEHDIAAAAAVAAVGSAPGDVGLPAEAEAAVAAGSGQTWMRARSCITSDAMADPVFLITGASSGIGAATARAAARPATALVLAARSTDKLERARRRARRRRPGAGGHL